VLCIGLLLMVCAGCSGIGGLDDKVSTGVIDGQLHVLSCWDDDRLQSVRIVRPDGSAWSATEHAHSGLPLDEPLTMQQVEASTAYDVSGELPGELVAGDHVYFETSRESRNYVVTAELVSDEAPLSC